MDPGRREAKTGSHGTARRGQKWGIQRPLLSPLLCSFCSLGDPIFSHTLNANDPQVHLHVQWGPLSISTHLLDLSSWIASKIEPGSFNYSCAPSPFFHMPENATAIRSSHTCPECELCFSLEVAFYFFIFFLLACFPMLLAGSLPSAKRHLWADSLMFLLPLSCRPTS